MPRANCQVFSTGHQIFLSILLYAYLVHYICVHHIRGANYVIPGDLLCC